MADIEKICLILKHFQSLNLQIAENLSHQEMNEGDLLSWLSILEQEKVGSPICIYTSEIVLGVEINTGIDLLTVSRGVHTS